MRFSKLHGCGNDYVFIDNRNGAVSEPNDLSIRVADRHFGIGSDGLILLERSDVADIRMAMYNADGSRGAMCGNGLRCLAAFANALGVVPSIGSAVDTSSAAGAANATGARTARVASASDVASAANTAGASGTPTRIGPPAEFLDRAVAWLSGTHPSVSIRLDDAPLFVETDAGVRYTRLIRADHRVAAAVVSIGPSPATAGTGADDATATNSATGGAAAGDAAAGSAGTSGPGAAADAAAGGSTAGGEETIALAGVQRRFIPVDTGSKHAVIFLDDLAGVDLPIEGPAWQNTPRFPQGVNVHFVLPEERDRARAIHWERGSGPTLACGTGAAAIVAAGVASNRLDPCCRVRQKGGELLVLVDHEVWLAGPVVHVFDGDWPAT